MSNYWQYQVGFGTVNNSGDCQVLIAPAHPSLQGLRITPSLSGTQTANLLSIENSAGTEVFSVDADGNMRATLATTGDMNFGGAVAITGNVSALSAVDITGNVRITGTLVVTGAPTLRATVSALSGMEIGGNARVTGTFTATGNATLVSAADIGGNARITGTLAITGAETAKLRIGFTSVGTTGGSAGGAPIDWTAGNIQSFTCTGSVAATATFTSPGGPAVLNLLVRQSAESGGTIVWPAAVKFPTGSFSVPSTATASNIDMVQFVFDGTNYWATVTKTLS